nr:MAG TPA: hypothetical protein [Caudoviricetes sp.]
MADGHPFCTHKKRKPDDCKITGLFFLLGGVFSRPKGRSPTRHQLRRGFALLLTYAMLLPAAKLRHPYCSRLS